MRTLRVFLVTALSASVLVVGSGAPAQAASCSSNYLAAVSNPPPAPNPADVVTMSGGTITVNTEVVSAYALAVTNHFATATTAYANCQVAEGYNYAFGRAVCLLNTPGMANLLRSSNPTIRYVQVIGGVVHVHYRNLIIDAQDVIACTEIVLPELS